MTRTKVTPEEKAARKQVREVARQRRDVALKSMKKAIVCGLRNLRRDREWKATGATSYIETTYKTRAYFMVWIRNKGAHGEHHTDATVAAKRNVSHARWVQHMTTAMRVVPRPMQLEWGRLGASVGWCFGAAISFQLLHPGSPAERLTMTTSRKRFQCIVWIRRMVRRVLDTDNTMSVSPVQDIVIEYLGESGLDDTRAEVVEDL